MANEYATLAELRNWIMPNLADTDLSQDASLNAALTATSRLIDEHTGRRFYTTAADETLYFTASDTALLMPHDLGVDILSITTLSADEDGDRTYERTWLTTDFDLEPYNAASRYKPYTHVRTTPDGSYSFPIVAKGIKIIGKFGYCTLANVPVWAPDVRMACLIQAGRLFERRVTPLGVSASGMFGEGRLVHRLDPDVELMLGNLRRELIF